MLKEFSIKHRILLILMGISIPLVVFILIFNFYTINILNKKVSEAIDNTLYLQSNNLEETLKTVENAMGGLIMDNQYFAALKSDKLSELDKYLNAYEVMRQERAVLQTYSDIAACALISKTANVNQISFNLSYSPDDTDQKLKEFLAKLLTGQDGSVRYKWFPVMVGDRGYLLRIMGGQDTFIIYIINLNDILLFQDNKNSDNTAVTVFFDKDYIYTGRDFIEKKHLKLLYLEDYYFTGKEKKYMVCESEVDGSSVRIAYLTPYNGIFIDMSFSQILFFIISLLTILSIPLGYFLLKHTFFSPIDRLVKTMERIGQGEEIIKEEGYREVEFQKVNDTLFRTLEEIKELKIESYEKELKVKEITLQYFQIQIRPHFFLNCLKNIYGMVEEGNFGNIQKLIIHLSRHLRYMLQDNSKLVTIEEELQYVKNYIEIQQISLKYPPNCSLDVETGTMQFMIPPVSILSFIENSVKYSDTGSRCPQIKISIKALKNEEEELIYIRVSDNGSGFSEEDLTRFNYLREDTPPDMHIGIYNIIQRFHLYYGKGKVGFVFSNDGGAVIEVYIERGQEDEHIDC